MKLTVFKAILGLFLLAGVLIGVSQIIRSSVPGWELSSDFESTELKLDTYDLFDLGVAKIDQDQNLDLFSVNHSARQLFRSAERQTGYLSDIGLGQSAVIASADAAGNAPQITSDGIYIYRDKKILVFKVQGTQDIVFPVELSVSMPWPISVLNTKNVSVKQIEADSSQSSTEGGPIGWHTVEINLSERGVVELTGQQDILELPHKITVNENQIQQFRIGNDRELLNPDLLKIDAGKAVFELQWRDRHAMAWHDINDDGISDVFIGRGGVKGQLKKLSINITDELILRGSDSNEDIAVDKKLNKVNCPARKSSWVDINADSILDLFVSCGRVAGGNFPDQLYIVDENDQYTESAKSYGINNSGYSVYRFLDIDMDGDQDQLIYDGKDLLLKKQNNNKYDSEVLVTGMKSKPAQIALTDIDGDLDLDAFVVLRKNSIVLINDSGSFTPAKPESIGLPSALRTISFVDIDLDGRMDAHAVPSGVYMNAGASFEKHKGFSDESELKLLSNAICQWYDPDLDGAMNAVCTYERYPRWEKRIFQKSVMGEKNTRFWTTHALESKLGADNHWLQIDLVGPAGNREALGSSVTVTTEDSTVRQYVGQFEQSHYSQGHYRLYFGLGANTAVKEVVVDWADGLTQSVSVNSVDKLLKIAKPEQ